MTDLLAGERIECPHCDRELRRVGTPLHGFWECSCGFTAARL